MSNNDKKIPLTQLKRTIELVSVKYWLIPELTPILPDEVSRYNNLLQEALQKIDELNALSNQDGIVFCLDIGVT